MKDAIKNLKIAAMLIADSKVLINNHVETARILLNEETIHELKDLSLKIGSDTATIEGDLNEFERLGIGNKRFVIIK
jgi:hypothetical protein